MKLYEVRDILNADVLSGVEFMDQTVFGGGSADLMDDILSAVANGSVLLTGLTTEQAIRTAQIAKVGGIVYVRGKRPDQDIVTLAESLSLPLMTTRFSLFVASGKLYMNGLRGLDGSW